MNSLIKNFVLAASVAVLAGSAYANPELSITDVGTATTQTVTLSSGGLVTFDGAIGNWYLNIIAGDSGSPVANIDLSGDDAYNGVGSDSLIIKFSDTGFTTPGSVISGIGGTIGAGTSSLVYQTYSDASNTLFATTSLLATLSFNAVGPFSGGIAGAAATGSPYSLTDVVTIQNSGANPRGVTTSFDASLSVPDAGTTALLLGIGLIGIAVAARKLKSANA